ncbi:MAG: iron chaperone, partial [Candidatus Promineifilaceae bacterium]
PASRRDTIEAVRSRILDTVPEAEKSMRYKMPTHDVIGDFLAALASQKHYMSLYVNTVVMTARHKELGHLDCGKGCIRFGGLDELPLDVVRAILAGTYQKNRSA